MSSSNRARTLATISAGRIAFIAAERALNARSHFGVGCCAVSGAFWIFRYSVLISRASCGPAISFTATLRLSNAPLKVSSRASAAL